MVAHYSLSLDIPQGPNRQDVADLSTFTESKIKTSAACQERSWDLMQGQIRDLLIPLSNFLRGNGIGAGNGDMAAFEELFSAADSTDVESQGLAELIANNPALALVA